MNKEKAGSLPNIKEVLIKRAKEAEARFVRDRKEEILALLDTAALKMQTYCELTYHPLLDSFFEELVQGGLEIESRTLDKITLSWST